MRRWISALVVAVVGFSLGVNGLPEINAATAGETFFLCLAEGNPGMPGDTLFSSAVGGLFDHFFEVQPPFPLVDITNGLTIAAFPPSGVSLPDLSVQINFSVVGRPLTQCSIGVATSPNPHILVNGVQGTVMSFAQEDLHTLVDLVRAVPGCADVELHEFLFHSVILFDHLTRDFIRELDALAVGIGKHVFPTETTPVLCEVQVSIAIKSGEFPNSINPRSRGVIPVAILTTPTFDATTVDQTTVRFGATGTEAAPVRSALEDVNGDGDTDMILHFTTRRTGIECGETSALLTGETFDRQQIKGSDAVQTVGCK